MDQQTTNTRPADAMLTATEAADIASRKLRERLAAALALIIVLGFVVMMFVAFLFIGSGATDPAFDRVKDLLLFVNPLVGVVLGYYFNKVSTEARAENAERTAQAASSSLQTSQSTLQQTQTQLQTAQQTADEAKTTLGQLIDPVQQTLQQTLPSQGVVPESTSRGELDFGPGAPTLDPQTRLNLEMALARAKRLVGAP